MSHKEAASTIRREIKAAAIVAKVWMQTVCGTKVISVAVPEFDVEFSSDEIRAIVAVAKSNGLTGVRKSELNLTHEAQLTGKKQWNFEYHGL